MRRIAIRVAGPPAGFLIAHLLRLSSAPLGAALTYHSLAERSGDPAREIVPAVGRRVFAAQMRFARWCFRLVPASELPAAARARRRGQRIPLSVTFDDDLRSHLDTALPLLSRARIEGATFFLTGTGLSPDDVRAIVTEGHEIGFHTRAHEYLPDLGDAALARAMGDGRDELAQAGGGTVHELIAYPFGGADERVAAAARAAGFRVGYTTTESADYSGDPLLCGRIDPTPVSAGNLALRTARALLAAVRRPAAAPRSAPVSARSA